MRVFPSHNEKIITSTIFAFIAGSIMGVLVINKNINSGVLLTAIATLAAAFFGALAAYKLEDNRRKNDVKKNQLEDANKILFAFYERIVFLKNYQEKFVDPFRDIPSNAISMRPAINIREPESSFNIESILFLLSSKHKQIILNLQLEKERFNSTLSIIKYRSELHMNELQPALEKGGIREYNDYSKEQINEAIGERLLVSMEIATESLIFGVDETLKSNIEIKENFVSILKEVFPNKEMLDFKFIKNT